MNSSNKHSTVHQTGFTLVEIMVGLAIGMLATLVIMQVFSVFEAQKRTTTGTADAQTNGSIALYTIGRELQQAGYPLYPYGLPNNADSAIECTALTVDGAANTPNLLSPVVITDGAGTNASDNITIHYGDSLGGGIPSQIGAFPGATPNEAIVGSNVGCKKDDRTLIANGANCFMSFASAVSASSSAVPPAITLKDTSGAANNANIACLGTWNEVSYSVFGDNLVRAGAPVIAGIVNIQAQYGIAAAGVPSAQPNFNQVVQWVNATGIWVAPTVANRNRIKAVRITVVARNAKVEPDNVTVACTTVKGTVNNGPCAWDDSNVDAAPAINLSNDADGTSWQRYHYRVFETIIPLRNVIWSKKTL